MHLLLLSAALALAGQQGSNTVSHLHGLFAVSLDDILPTLAHRQYILRSHRPLPAAACKQPEAKLFETLSKRHL